MASRTFTAPANPAFLGATLYWQAMVEFPLHFTNVEKLVFTQY